MKNILILLVLLSTTDATHAENPCGVMSPQNSGQWGVGFLWFSPDAKVAVYNKPNGDKIGTVARDQYGKLSFQGSDSHKDFETNQNDFVWAGHISVTLLKTYKMQANFLNVMIQSKEAGLWIDLKGLGAEIKFVTYRSTLLKSEKEVPAEIMDLIRDSSIGVNLTETCLNLRKENSPESELVTCISSNDHRGLTGHTHLKILEIKDDWAKVDVTVYEYDSENDESGEGCAFRRKEKYSGWVKYIDKNGHPNIWYSTGTH